ncbi:MAG: hypothetical protein GY903_21005 [Fuerstiella sp.]|nr:hypothetical protein [Fuerstiella sp.]
MPRAIYKQPVGNPIQLNMVPKGDVELCFPIRPESIQDDIRRTWMTILSLVGVSAASILTQTFLLGRSLMPRQIHNGSILAFQTSVIGRSLCSFFWATRLGIYVYRNDRRVD